MLLLELLSRLQNSNISLLFWNLFTGLKFLNELNIKSSLSLTKFSIPLSLHIYRTLYLFSLLTVTTHALHLMSLSSNHHHHSKSLIDPSDMLHLIFEPAPYITQNSLPNHSSPSQRPSFEHAGLTCYTLLSPSITFHCFTLSSKPTFSENLILHLSLFLSVGLVSWL